MLWNFHLNMSLEYNLKFIHIKLSYFLFTRKSIFFLFGTLSEFKGSFIGEMSWWLHKREFGTNISHFLFREIFCTSSSKTAFKITSCHKNPEFHCCFPWCVVCCHQQSYFRMTLFKYLNFKYFPYKNLEKLIAPSSSVSTLY